MTPTTFTRARFLTLALTLSRGYTGEGTCRADDAQLAHVDRELRKGVE